MGFRKEIKDAKRIVVKVGTPTLTYANGQINLGRIEKLTRVLSDIVNSGKEVTLVTSGAVGVGVGKLKLKEKPTNIREKQALAAIGQCELMHQFIITHHEQNVNKFVIFFKLFFVIFNKFFHDLPIMYIYLAKISLLFL